MGWALAETFEAAVGAEGIASLDRPVANWFAAHRELAQRRRRNNLDHGRRNWGGRHSGHRRVDLVEAIRVVAAHARHRIVARRSGWVVPGDQAPHGANPTPNSGHLFDGSAFPSGHTTAAVAIAGSIAWLYCQGRPWNRQVATWTIAALAALLVGWSRAYLSAHWLTDVIGGWMLGAAWLAAVVATDAILLRRNNQGVGPSADPQVPGAHSPGSPSPTAGRRSPS